MLDRFDPSEVSENVRSRFYIGGKWVEPRTSARLELVSPLTEKVQFTVPAGAPEDMDDAVAAAADAFENSPWPRMSPTDRAKYLIAIGELSRRTGGKSGDSSKIGFYGAARGSGKRSGPCGTKTGASILHFLGGIRPKCPATAQSLRRR